MSVNILELFNQIDSDISGVRLNDDYKKASYNFYMHYFFSNYFQDFGVERMSYVQLQKINKDIEINIKEISSQSQSSSFINLNQYIKNRYPSISSTPVTINVFSIYNAFTNITQENNDINAVIDSIKSNIETHIKSADINIFTGSFDHIITFVSIKKDEDKYVLLYVNAGDGSDIQASEKSE